MSENTVQLEHLRGAALLEQHHRELCRCDAKDRPGVSHSPSCPAHREYNCRACRSIRQAKEAHR